MTKLLLDGYIVKEGIDTCNKLFFYSGMPVKVGADEFGAATSGDNVFEIELPIREFIETNEPQRCRITVELEK